MNNSATSIETLFERAEDYSKTTIELIKLSAIDKSAELVSSLAARLAIFMVVALFILIINIGLAMWIGELLGKTYYGFFAVGGFYVLISILLYAFRNQWIKTPVSNSIINQMLKKKAV
jgi:phosphoglycerol transferase MdoB-like AlkP superfamily enzyme